MITVRNILLSGQKGPFGTAEGSGTFYFPTCWSEAAQETVYQFSVEAVGGAPTSALLTAKFQSIQKTSQGNLANSWTFMNPQYFDLAAAGNAGLLPDGDWPAVMADETLAGPVSFIRRIRGGFPHRLAFTQTFTGGTEPYFYMTIEQLIRY